MNTPGSALRTEREKQKRSLEEIAKKLKIKVEYLKAIEEDNYQLLPGEVYTKAYMRLYAEALNLETDDLLSLYKDEDATAPPIETVHEEKKTVFNYKPLFAAAIILFVVVLAVVIMKRNTQNTDDEVTNEIIETEVDKVADEIIETEVDEEKEIEMLSIEFIAVELTWVSVSIDEARPEEWLLRTGETKTLRAHKGFIIKVGNAGGTKLLLNGKDMGELGPHGKVVDIVLP